MTTMRTDDELWPEGPTSLSEPLTVAEQGTKSKPPGPLTSSEDPLSPALIGHIYEDFLFNGRTIRELAQQYNVPLTRLNAVARRNDWIARRQELELEDLLKAESEYRKFLLESKLPTAKQQLSLSNGLLAKLSEVLDRVSTGEDADPKDAASLLRRLAEALKSASDVGARAAGLQDAPLGDYLAKTQGDRGQGRTPIMMLGLVPLPPEEEPEAQL